MDSFYDPQFLLALLRIEDRRLPKSFACCQTIRAIAIETQDQSQINIPYLSRIASTAAVIDFCQRQKSPSLISAARAPRQTTQL